MYTDGNTFRLCLVYHFLYTLVIVFREFRIPVEMSPVQERAAMVYIFESGNLSLIEDHIEIIFREIGDQIRFHGCTGCFTPFSVKQRVRKPLFDLDFTDTGQCIRILASEERYFRTFDQAVFSFYRENQ